MTQFQCVKLTLQLCPYVSVPSLFTVGVIYQLLDGAAFANFI